MAILFLKGDYFCFAHAWLPLFGIEVFLACDFLTYLCVVCGCFCAIITEASACDICCTCVQTASTKQHRLLTNNRNTLLMVGRVLESPVQLRHQLSLEPKGPVHRCCILSWRRGMKGRKLGCLYKVSIMLILFPRVHFKYCYVRD